MRCKKTFKRYQLGTKNEKFYQILQNFFNKFYDTFTKDESTKVFRLTKRYRVMRGVVKGVNPSRPNPDKEKKLSLVFIFTLLRGASKGFKKALKSFIKPFEASQRSVKIRI